MILKATDPKAFESPFYKFRVIELIVFKSSPWNIEEYGHHFIDILVESPSKSVTIRKPFDNKLRAKG